MIVLRRVPTHQVCWLSGRSHSRYGGQAHTWPPCLLLDPPPPPPNILCTTDLPKQLGDPLPSNPIPGTSTPSGAEEGRRLALGLAVGAAATAWAGTALRGVAPTTTPEP